MTLSDELIVELDRARAGDARGFDALFLAFGAPVAGFLRGRNVSDPDGLANVVFLRAFRNIHTFRGDGDRFRSWLFTIAYNVAIDDARRRRRRVEETTLERAPEQTGGNVEDEVLVRLANERVARLLRGLSPDQRDVLLLRIVSDLTVEETAAVLGKGYEAVRALQRRGLASLRRAISHEEGVRQ